MRRSPITIGMLTAELALGALVLAPPAAADDEPAAEPNPTEVPAEPEPVETPAVAVRTGRSGDPNALTPVASSDLPTHDEAPEEPDAPAPPTTPAPPPDPAPGPAPSAPAPAAAGVPEAPGPAAPPPAPAASAPPAHTVVRGDSLWSIAAAHLASSTGREVGAIPVAELALYWVRVCDANRANLRSGDLDLIYPGEVVTLPAP